MRCSPVLLGGVILYIHYVFIGWTQVRFTIRCFFHKTCFLTYIKFTLSSALLLSDFDFSKTSGAKVHFFNIPNAEIIKLMCFLFLKGGVFWYGVIMCKDGVCKLRIMRHNRMGVIINCINWFFLRGGRIFYKTGKKWIIGWWKVVLEFKWCDILG